MNLDPVLPPTGSGHRAQAREAAAAFAVATALFIGLHAHHDVRIFPFDAALYWALADLPRFHAVPDNIRGYVLAELLAPARYLCGLTDSLWPFRLYLSAIYGWALTWLVPEAYRRFFGGQLSLGRRLVPAVLMAALFPGVLLYPMSDLPAVLLMLGALLSLRTASMAAGPAGLPLHWVALAGALAAAAYNVRTIYLFLLVGSLVSVLLVGRRARLPRRLAEASVFGIAALALLMPQALLNQQLHGRLTFNPALQSTGQSLFVAQLIAGLGVQRYETVVSAPLGPAAVLYADPAGRRLVAQPGGSTIRSTGDYLRHAASHPLEFAGLLARHLINGLDVRDGRLYLYRLSETRNGLALFNFLVLAAAAWAAALQMTRYRPPGTQPAPHWRLWLLLWLAPVAFILPGMVETRFFLPLHLLAWCALALHFDRRMLATSFREHPVLITATIAACACVFFAVTLSTMANRVGA